jgi:hypothetical protein
LPRPNVPTAHFIRLEFDKVYDAMLAAPLSVYDVLIGEIAWAATIGMFFSLIVVVVVACFGLVPMPASLLTIVPGFLTGIMFAVSFAAGDVFRAEYQSIQFLFHRVSLPDVFLLRRGVPHRKPSPRPAHRRGDFSAYPRGEARAVFGYADAVPHVIMGPALYHRFHVIIGWIAINRLRAKLIQ